MKELMIHVERIVKPIVATQGRKLRMRSELLAHLHAALAEERHRSAGDERTAIEHAKHRLGEPVELTRILQQTVPIFERTLFAKLPISRRLDHLEQRMSHMPGQRGAMTLGHKTILIGMAVLNFAPLLISMYSAVTTSDMQSKRSAVCFIGGQIGGLALLLACYHFVFAAASSDDRLDRSGMLKRGATILAMQMALTYFFTFAIANRVATIGDVIISATSTIALLAVSTLIARRIGVLRRPYDEWLTLNIAE
jgi:hypothetical protein